MSKIYKPKQISGYPEYLPEERLIELEWLDKIRNIFESYGFCSIETPAVEELEVISAKGGDADKEIYTLTRLQADEKDQSDARLALHFDQTVPFARYTAQHFNDLVFPFKRYQMQKVWRGERPQKGRFREFRQCDIDVINIDNLPISFDAEMPLIMHEIYQALNLPPVQIKISNRKILFGYLTAIGITDIQSTTRILDKIDKIGADGVKTALMEELNLSDDMAEQSLKLAKVKVSDLSFIETVKSLNIENDLMMEGLEELEYVAKRLLKDIPVENLMIDLSMVRGLDYYTGTVIEAVFIDDPLFGAVGSGGRYNDLAASYINKKLPGVGVSIGVSRIFAWMLDKDLLETSRKSPAEILVIVPSEEMQDTAYDAAKNLRKLGHKVELFHSASKIKKQLSYAEKKGIPYIWFPPFKEGQDHEVKNMATGEQKIADINQGLELDT